MRLALLLAIFSVCLPAQSPRPSDEARRLLASTLLRERAWGAWYAGASHDPALGALLIERLGQARTLRNSSRDSAEYAYAQSLFDALIQLGAPVPTAAMMPFEDSWRAEILILMSGHRPGDDPFLDRHNLDGDAEAALIAMRDHEMPEAEWTAVNDLLFAVDSKTASQKLLQEIRVTYEVCVADQPTIRADDGSSSGRGSARHFPRGFPPIALYQIRTFGVSSGDAILLNGPVPAYYARIIVPEDGEAKWVDISFHGASASTRQRTIERFLGTFADRLKQTPDEIFHPWTAVDWRGTEQTGQEIADLLDGQTASIRSVVQEMAHRGMIEASGRRIPVAVIVRDCRRDRREPLPHIETTRQVVIP